MDAGFYLLYSKTLSAVRIRHHHVRKQPDDSLRASRHHVDVDRLVEVRAPDGHSIELITNPERNPVFPLSAMQAPLESIMLLLLKLEGID